MLCSWTNPPAELILRHRPCWLIGVASSLLFRLLFLFCFLLPTASGQLQKSQSQLLQPPMSTQFPGNLTELTGLTIEPNWPLEEFDQRRPAKRRHSNGENALTSRYGLRIDHCPDGGQPEQDSLNGQVKLCQLDDECRPSYKCQNIIGLTHFGKQMRYCCPTKTTACTERPKLEPIIPGRCRPLKIFYYFDVDQLTCVKARMAQCEDFGRNRFASELECRTKCETTACELGESILLHNSSFDKPFVCESDEDCPVGYNCRQDRIFRRSVCCGFLDFEPCPLGFRSFTVPFSGRPKSCVSSDTRDECPTDYVCTQNQINQEHYCCTVEKGVCPDGHQAYIHPLTDGTIKCNLHGYESTTACPPGYACLAAVFGSPWGFCCSQAVVASCPEDSFPQINPLTNQPKRCELMQLHSCSKGFVCESDSASHLGFCCSIPRRFTKKRTHPAELIPRKKIRPKVPITTEAPPEEEEMPVVEETALTTMPPPSPPPQTMPTTQPPTQTTTMPTTSGRGGRRKGEGKRRGGGKGRRKKKNRPRSGGGRKRARSREEEGETAGSEEAETQNPSSSSALESNEMQKSMERHELNSLSTKLDRFITGIRRKSELPSGHRGKPHIWRLKKGWGRGQSKMTPAPRRLGETEEAEEEEHGEGEETEEEQKAKKSRTRRPPRPKCPFGYDPMAYPGTKWTYLECLLPPEKRNGKKMKKKKKRPRKREEDEENVFRKEAEDEEVDEEEEGEENGDEKGGSEESHPAAAICPKPAICMPAKQDPFMRALCCVKKGEEEVEDTNEEEASEEGRKLGRRKKGRRKDLAEEDENDEDDEGGVDEEAEEEAEVEDAEDGLAGKSEVDTTAPTTTASSSTTTTTTTTTAMTTTTSSRPSTRPPPALSVLMVEKSSDATCPRLIADRTCKPGSARDCREPGFFCQFNKDKRQFVCCSKNL